MYETEKGFRGKGYWKKKRKRTALIMAKFAHGHDLIPNQFLSPKNGVEREKRSRSIQNALSLAEHEERKAPA